MIVSKCLFTVGLHLSYLIYSEIVPKYLFIMQLIY